MSVWKLACIFVSSSGQKSIIPHIISGRLNQSSIISIRRSVEVIAGTEESTIGGQRKAAPLRSFSQSLKTVLDIWLLSCSYSAMHFRITLQRMPINSPADFNALISAMQTRDGEYNWHVHCLFTIPKLMNSSKV